MSRGQKPLGEKPMSAAERQARYRDARVRYRRPAERRSPQRWRDTVAELVELQAEHQAWLDSLPGSLEERATAETLRGSA